MTQSHALHALIIVKPALLQQCAEVVIMDIDLIVIVITVIHHVEILTTVWIVIQHMKQQIALNANLDILFKIINAQENVMQLVHLAQEIKLLIAYLVQLENGIIHLIIHALSIALLTVKFVLKLMKLNALYVMIIII